jgi:hypothetical protein
VGLILDQLQEMVPGCPAMRSEISFLIFGTAAG